MCGGCTIEGPLVFLCFQGCSSWPTHKGDAGYGCDFGKGGPLDSLFPFGPEGLEGLVWGVSMVAWWGGYFCLVVFMWLSGGGGAAVEASMVRYVPL